MALNTTEGVTAAITKLLGSKQIEQTSPAALAALEAVVSLIESRSTGNPKVTEAMRKVRDAYGLTQPTEETDA